MAYSYEFEPINGNFFQTIAYYFNVYKPVNGSWMQAICESESVGITEPYNGSWELAFAYYFYVNFYTGPAEDFEIKNGSYWQTVLYYNSVDEQYFIDNFELNVAFPINGSWANTYYQYLRNSDEGGIIQPGYIISLSEPVWGGTATIGTYKVIFNNFITDGDGLGSAMGISFTAGEISKFGITFGGSGYKVGDTLTIPSLTDPRVTGDIVFTVLEVLEY